MPRGLSDEVLKAVRARRPVFTITAGRTGSAFLQQLFALLPETRSEHEPQPDFVHVLRRGQLNPEASHRFCLEVKLPAIAAVSEKRYVETSHLFCKGFVESFLLAGVVPDVVLLRRPPRQIAHSLFGIQTVPARTALGMMYLLSPDDPMVLPLPGWKTLSDYQLCFWYCLEIERRQLHYARLLRELGGAVVERKLSDLTSFPRFVEMATALGFAASEGDEDLGARFATVCATRHNDKPKTELGATPEQCRMAEEVVWDRIAYYDPLLRARMEQTYGRP